MLEGWRRGGEKKSWKNGPTASGGLRSGPPFPEICSRLISNVRNSANRARLVRLPPNWPHWRDGPKRPLRTGSVSWLLYRAAKWLDDEKNWKEAGAAYEHAIRLAPAARPKIIARLLSDRGDVLT